jgi:FtsH-binding integral membrane protein
MSFGNDFSLDYGREQSESIAAERAVFIRRTYAHLAGAVLAFIGLEWALLSIPGIETTVFGVLSHSRYSWLLVLLAFMGVSTLASYWASSQTSKGVQYLGLGLYVVAEAIIFLPLLILAQFISKDQNLIPTAGILTLALVVGLTAVVFITKKDFSFLGSVLAVCGFIALGVIVASIIMGFGLGMFFCIALIVMMSAAILYHTSNVLHHYHTEQYVAASLALFASIATLFWYILQLLMILGSGRE